ncbi:MAG: isopentenyl-diphosphate Delta-isomerase [Woeseiaceae bacterium]|nr:isopentenyl-diphosphate Delta-isomerase [Woeseiaceae bacterium]
MNEGHAIVSSEDEPLILVDDEDNELGTLSKGRCHDGGGVRHRAFSLFLFDDDGRMLVQRRSATKRLWPGFWSNSCCSHPRRGETMAIATARRLSDELGIQASLQPIYHFCYTARFEEAGSENELCHVYLGKVNGEVRPNSSEIAEIRFVSARDLDDELLVSPEHFTPWFKQEWQTLKDTYAKELAGYCSFD